MGDGVCIGGRILLLLSGFLGFLFLEVDRDCLLTCAADGFILLTTGFLDS